MTEKICPICKEAFDITSFGTQRYCRTCWREYNREQQAKYRAKRRKRRVAKKQHEALLLLSPEARTEQIDAMKDLYEQFPDLKEDG